MVTGLLIAHTEPAVKLSTAIIDTIIFFTATYSKFIINNP